MTEAVRVESVEDDDEEMNLMETGGDGASTLRLLAVLLHVRCLCFRVFNLAS